MFLYTKNLMRRHIGFFIIFVFLFILFSSYFFWINRCLFSGCGDSKLFTHNGTFIFNGFLFENLFLILLYWLNCFILPYIINVAKKDLLFWNLKHKTQFFKFYLILLFPFFLISLAVIILWSLFTHSFFFIWNSERVIKSLFYSFYFSFQQLIFFIFLGLIIAWLIKSKVVLYTLFIAFFIITIGGPSGLFLFFHTIFYSNPYRYSFNILVWNDMQYLKVLNYSGLMENIFLKNSHLDVLNNINYNPSNHSYKTEIIFAFIYSHLIFIGIILTGVFLIIKNKTKTAKKFKIFNVNQ